MPEAEEIEISVKNEIVISVDYSCAQCDFTTDSRNQVENHIRAFHKLFLFSLTESDFKTQVESRNEVKAIVPFKKFDK